MKTHYCPACHAALDVPPHYEGKTVKCGGCGGDFVAGPDNMDSSFPCLAVPSGGVLSQVRDPDDKSGWVNIGCGALIAIPVGLIILVLFVKWPETPDSHYEELGRKLRMEKMEKEEERRNNLRWQAVGDELENIRRGGRQR